MPNPRVLAYMPTCLIMVRTAWDCFFATAAFGDPATELVGAGAWDRGDRTGWSPPSTAALCKDSTLVEIPCSPRKTTITRDRTYWTHCQRSKRQKFAKKKPKTESSVETKGRIPIAVAKCEQCWAAGCCTDSRTPFAVAHCLSLQAPRTSQPPWEDAAARVVLIEHPPKCNPEPQSLLLRGQ